MIPMSDEIREIESKVAPPTINCPNCESMLPHELGEITCVVCSAISRIEHKPTRDNWIDEKVSCPNCPKILRVGVDERPCAPYSKLHRVLSKWKSPVLHVSVNFVFALVRVDVA